MIAWILTVFVISNGAMGEIEGATFETYDDCVAAAEMVVDGVAGERNDRVIATCTAVNA